MKTLKNKLSYALCILFALCFLLSCNNNEPTWSVKQNVEFYTEANGKYNYTIGYKVETRLTIKQKDKFSYDLIFGDFVKTEPETYGKLADQLCTADSMIAITMAKY